MTAGTALAAVYVPDEWTQLYACRAANVAAYHQAWRSGRSAVARLRELDAAGLWLHEQHPLFTSAGTAIR